MRYNKRFRANSVIPREWLHRCKVNHFKSLIRSCRKRNVVGMHVATVFLKEFVSNLVDFFNYGIIQRISLTLSIYGIRRRLRNTVTGNGAFQIHFHSFLYHQ